MNIPNLFVKFLPLTAAAALAMAATPVLAAPHGGHGGGGRGGGGHMGGAHASFHGGGGSRMSFHGGGGHAFHGGGHMVFRGGGHFHNGPVFRGRGGWGPGWGVGLGWPYYGGYYDNYGYAPDYYYDYGSSPTYSSSYADDTGTAVQEALASAGYYRGPIDGIVGAGTIKAIMGYQRDHGLPVTGNIDNRLLSSLGVN